MAVDADDMDAEKRGEATTPAAAVVAIVALATAANAIISEQFVRKTINHSNFMMSFSSIRERHFRRCWRHTRAIGGHGGARVPADEWYDEK